MAQIFKCDLTCSWYPLLCWFEWMGAGMVLKEQWNAIMPWICSQTSQNWKTPSTQWCHTSSMKKTTAKAPQYHLPDIDAAKMCHRQTVGWDTQTDQTDSPYPSNIFLTREGVIYRQTILKCWNHTTQYGLTDNDRHRFWSWQVSTLPPHNVCSCTTSVPAATVSSTFHLIHRISTPVGAYNATAQHKEPRTDILASADRLSYIAAALFLPFCCSAAAAPMVQLS